MKHLLILLLAIVLSGCLLAENNPVLFKNKVFYGDWRPISSADISIGIMTVTPNQVLYSKDKDTPVYNCSRIIDQTDEAVMIECYTNGDNFKGKVYKIFKLYKPSYYTDKSQTYIEVRFCVAREYDHLKLSLENFKNRCSRSVRVK